PGAGDRGGEITAQGSPSEVMDSPSSLTGRYLSGRQAIPVPRNRRLKIEDRGSKIEIRNPKSEIRSSNLSLTANGGRQNNFNNLDVAFPLGPLIAGTRAGASVKRS